MLTAKQLYSRIDDIVDRSYLGFLFMLAGADALTDEQKRKVEALGLIIGRKPLIELLYVLIRNRPTEGYANDATLSTLLDQIANQGVLPVINDAQQSTLDTAKAAFMDSVETTKQEIKKQVRQQMVEMNREQRQDVAVNRVSSISQVKEREEKLRDKLKNMIPKILLAAHVAFERSLAAALTDFVNDAEVDNVTVDSILTGVPSRDAIVGKRVKNDGSLCRWCRKFYVDENGSPKLYKLSELQANGSNYGKPKSEWKPTIGKTHPFCRCVLFRKNS